MTLDAFIPTREQSDIVAHDRSAFIIACPGAGKTRVMVERCRGLTARTKGRRGVALLSFTNAAVHELETRLRHANLIVEPTFPDFVGTFDGFVWQFILAPFGIPECENAPRLIADLDRRIVQPFEKAHPLPLSCFDRATGEIVPALAKAKGYDVAKKAAGVRKASETVARTMRKRFRDRGEVDFEDVRSIARERLADRELSERLGNALAARFAEIIVDEAQDCNPHDLEIISWLRTAGIPIKVICDPHQSIYEFRGGVTDHLFAFRDKFEEEDRLPMTGNFRSNDNICKAIAMLRSHTTRGDIDKPVGRHKADQTPVHILSYKGAVSAAIGTRFRELATGHSFDLADCPILASTVDSGAKSIGQPRIEKTNDLSLRLASAVMEFHYGFDTGNQLEAIHRAHAVILSIQGRLAGKTYNQYLTSEQMTAETWRPKILSIVQQLRFDPSIDTTANGWLARARALIAPEMIANGLSIAQRLKSNRELASLLTVPPPASAASRTIHSVKGKEFPAVCVVMTTATAKGILDYLQTGEPAKTGEDARKLYVAASRAERLLVFASPRSQAARLKSHLETLHATVTLEEI
ncbi:UvrD-helicase domain-containing protein [Bosea sp. 124]|uniref:UvrD-helicase domain-containing protein n=1 Tax=Bosea sp. 124 TaxID=2135642 RepID=UPI000D3A92D8|nr:UvrD-helicase domain-containing protein [Bosea sp. 124]PTM40520.1 UvrD-like helicase family protein [Bosea sp. 124]